MSTRILAALVVCLAASTQVVAGEIKGTGEYIEQRGEAGRSICSYSGLNDEFYDEAYEGDFPRVQSFGQIARGLKGILGGGPGGSCNPNG